MSNYVRNVKDAAETQENLNPQQSEFPILARSVETLLLEEGPTIVYANDVSDMAIWGNPNTTWGGPDLNDQWGSYSDNKVIFRVSNPRDIFIERFAFTTLRGASNTSTWDTTNKEVTFTSGQVLLIESAFLDSSSTEVVTGATLDVTVDSGIFDYELSADGGINWETVTNGVPYTFTNTGSDLRIRVTEALGGQQLITSDGDTFLTSAGENFLVLAAGGVTGTITLIKCKYNK